MAATSYDSDEALGKVLFVLGGIQSRLDSIEKNFVDERIGAQQHRQDLRIVIAALTQSTQDLTSKFSTLADRVNKIEPYAESWRDRVSEERGAGKVVLFFRGLVVVLAAAVGAIAAYLGASHGR